MSARVVYRRARTPDELRRADNLAARSGPYGAKPPSFYGAVWLLTEGGHDIAYGAAYLDKEAGTVTLATCGGARVARGRGLQRPLIRQVHAWARRHGILIGRTYCSADNWPSLGNLLRCGYVVVGFRSDETASGGGYVDVEAKLRRKDGKHAE